MSFVILQSMIGRVTLTDIIPLPFVGSLFIGGILALFRKPVSNWLLLFGASGVLIAGTYFHYMRMASSSINTPWRDQTDMAHRWHFGLGGLRRQSLYLFQVYFLQSGMDKKLFNATNCQKPNKTLQPTPIGMAEL